MSETGDSTSRGLAPVQVDLRVVIVWGMVAWLIGLVTLIVIDATGNTAPAGWIGVCAVGAGLGLPALLWESRNRARYRAIAEAENASAS